MINLQPLTITKLSGGLFSVKEFNDADCELLMKCLDNYDDTIKIAPRDIERPVLSKVRKTQGEELQRESDA